MILQTRLVLMVTSLLIATAGVGAWTARRSILSQTEMNGLLAALKADPDPDDIPVVLHTMMDNQEMGFALGAADYLMKPVNWEQLLQKAAG